jgi:hypothetical protein
MYFAVFILETWGFFGGVGGGRGRDRESEKFEIHIINS